MAKERWPLDLTDFGADEFSPYVQALGQATLYWNDLHEWLGRLYGIAMGWGLQNPHLQVWAALSSDRAKREILLAAARTNYVDIPVNQTALQKKTYKSVKWLADRTTELENDRNNITHAPLWIWEGKVSPASLQGNKRAANLNNKHLMKEYSRIRDGARTLRDYAAAIYRAAGDPKLAWPDTPQWLGHEATNAPPQPRPGLYVKP